MPGLNSVRVVGVHRTQSKYRCPEIRQSRVTRNSACDVLYDIIVMQGTYSASCDVGFTSSCGNYEHGRKGRC
jgi:hypothetical protein